MELCASVNLIEPLGYDYEVIFASYRARPPKFCDQNFGRGSQVDRRTKFLSSEKILLDFLFSVLTFQHSNNPTFQQSNN